MANIERIVFFSLILDLFGQLLLLFEAVVLSLLTRHSAFTIPLPLFPRIVEWYTKVWIHPMCCDRKTNLYLLEAGVVERTWPAFTDASGCICNTRVALCRRTELSEMGRGATRCVSLRSD